MLSVDAEARQFLPSQNILIKNSLNVGNAHYRQWVRYELAIKKRGSRKYGQRRGCSPKKRAARKPPGSEFRGLRSTGEDRRAEESRQGSAPISVLTPGGRKPKKWKTLKPIWIRLGSSAPLWRSNGKKADPTRGRSRINFATLTLRLQSSSRQLRTRMSREMRKRSLTLRTRHFSPHLLSRLVRPEPDVDRLPQ